MRINFDFTDLQVFLTLAELGSFQRAAEQMSISQSAITRRIQKLEHALGITLFERTTRTLKLSQQGRHFRPRAESILDDANEAVNALVDHSSQFEHQKNTIITVAAIPTTTYDLLPQIIKQFHADGFKARINILDLLANDVTEAVAKGDADFGIGFSGIKEPGLEFESLIEDYFVLAMHPEHRLTEKDVISWQDLEGLPLIVPWKGTGNRMLIDNEMARCHQKLEWHFQVHHSSTGLGLVEANVGVAILPASAVPKRAYSMVASRPLVDPRITRMIGAVRRENHTLTPKAEAFYQLLLCHCQRQFI